ncbi:helix-turn-helix domain-containing protein [Paenibacillus sacheonensis]|uniref:Helix-turn-helix domain-containing protein n=1 Tax=Paenibacillus sacheonensis TaxID=742054 RepID=A0A7X4YW13_9BACL|nr:AraC family transcriptional regulator [Paenibacillus sacheonensis]NBC72609.1 helix-turn-helix domain-containing protein [Paenibacillus sacheonensis]
MEFTPLALGESISIPKLYSFHYFEYAKGFVFEGEEHDFWEFLYVDKGEVEVRADDRTIKLSQGEMIFHKPGEFHTVRVAQEHKPPNLIVISFECRSPDMVRFEDKVIALGKRERELLALLLQEGFRTFSPAFDDPRVHRLSPHPEAPYAGQQVMRSYLELLLIFLLRGEGPAVPESPRLTSMHQDNAEMLAEERILAYMQAHLADNLTLDQLCRAMHLGKTRLKEIFQTRIGTGAMEYFKQLKITEAKSLIREQQYNLTEIAAKLGYASIHYFSRDFKRSTGMSPSDYARSVKARAESRD